MNSLDLHRYLLKRAKRGRAISVEHGNTAALPAWDHEIASLIEVGKKIKARAA